MAQVTEEFLDDNFDEVTHFAESVKYGSWQLLWATSFRMKNRKSLLVPLTNSLEDISL